MTMDGLFNRLCASRHNGPSEWEIQPMLVPTSDSVLCTKDIHITSIVLTNDTNAAITFNFKDKQGTAAPLVPTNLSIAAYNTVSFELSGALMVGGINWSCSGTGLWARVRGF
jgi:hypothetical protein